MRNKETGQKPDGDGRTIGGEYACAKNNYNGGRA